MSRGPIHRNSDTRALSTHVPVEGDGRPAAPPPGASIAGAVDEAIHSERKPKSPLSLGTLAPRAATFQLRNFGTPAQVLFSGLQRGSPVSGDESAQPGPLADPSAEPAPAQDGQSGDSPTFSPLTRVHTPPAESQTVSSPQTQLIPSELDAALEKLKTTIENQPAADDRVRPPLRQVATPPDSDGDRTPTGPTWPVRQAVTPPDGDRTPTGPRRLVQHVATQAAPSLAVPTAHRPSLAPTHAHPRTHATTVNDSNFNIISKLARVDDRLIRGCEARVKSVTSSDPASIKVISAMTAGFGVLMQRIADPAQAASILRLTAWLDGEISRHLKLTDGSGEAIASIVADQDFARRCSNRMIHRELKLSRNKADIDREILGAASRLTNGKTNMPKDVGLQLADLLVQTVKPAAGTQAGSRVPNLVRTVAAVMEAMDDLSDEHLADALVGFQPILKATHGNEHESIQDIFDVSFKELSAGHRLQVTDRMNAMERRGGIDFEDANLRPTH